MLRVGLRVVFFLMLFGLHKRFDAEPTLTAYGTHQTNEAITPLFVISYGDTPRAERLAQRFQIIGPNALHAHIWIKSDDGFWLRTSFLRPQSLEEMARFIDAGTPPDFPQEQDALPVPLCFLPLKEQAKIYFVVRYVLGGTKIYLESNLTAEDAQGFNCALEEVGILE